MKKVFFLIIFLFYLVYPSAAQTKSDLALGFESLADKNPEAARAYFVREISSGDASLIEYADFGLARANFDLGNYDAAKEEFDRFIVEFKDSVLVEDAAYFLDKAKMKMLVKKRKFAAYKPDPKKLFAKAEDYFERGDYNSATALFSKLARDYPRHKLTAKAFLMLGRAELETGDESSSIKDLEKSYRLSSGTEQGKSLYYLGRTYGRRGRYEKAIKIMGKVAVNFPNSNYADNALYYLALYYEKTDSPQAALSTYVNLIINYPKSAFMDEAILRAGYLYSQRGEYQNAFNVYSLAKKYSADEGTPQSLFLWGLTAEKLGRTDSAAGIYYYVAEKYDHTFQSYRAKEKLSKLGYARPLEKAIPASLITSEIDESKVVDEGRLKKYGKLLELGLTDFAFLEAKELLSKTEGAKKESAQQSLARIMQKAGEYSIPIRYTERKIKNAIWKGTAGSIPFETWQLAYPKGFWQKVYDASIKYGIDPYLTLAVIREESRFNAQALSRARAHGLMQIMPSTGRLLAADLEIPSFKKSKMYNPDINIEMGTYYLSTLIKRFDGNIALALAGYNGGPSRVKKWVNNWYNGDNANLDVDEFIQNIPIRETRLYVQKVMGSYYEYKRIYNGK